MAKNEQAVKVTSENARIVAGRDGHIIKNVLTRTQAEYKKKLREELNKAEVLDYTKADKITVGAWLDTWYENYVKTTLRPVTIKNYEILIWVHVKSIIGDIDLQLLAPTYLQ